MVFKVKVHLRGGTHSSSLRKKSDLHQGCKLASIAMQQIWRESAATNIEEIKPDPSYKFQSVKSHKETEVSVEATWKRQGRLVYQRI